MIALLWEKFTSVSYSPGQALITSWVIRMTPPNDADNSSQTDAHVVTSDGDSVTVDVVIAVSDALGTAPDDLEPLESVIDTEALESLVVRGEEVTVEFEYERCTVTVSSDGVVRVDPPTQSI